MRKVLSTIVLALAFVASGTPVAFAAAGPAADLPTTCVYTDPFVGTVTTNGVTYSLGEDIYGLHVRIRDLEFAVKDARWAMHRRYVKIHKQAREIRHLRAQLRAARAQS